VSSDRCPYRLRTPCRWYRIEPSTGGVLSKPRQVDFIGIEHHPCRRVPRIPLGGARIPWRAFRLPRPKLSRHCWLLRFWRLAHAGLAYGHLHCMFLGHRFVGRWLLDRRLLDRRLLGWWLLGWWLLGWWLLGWWLLGWWLLGWWLLGWWLLGWGGHFTCCRGGCRHFRAIRLGLQFFQNDLERGNEGQNKGSFHPFKKISLPHKMLTYAPVAQLDSASVFGTEGCRFESCRVYSTYVNLASQLYLGTHSIQSRGVPGWRLSVYLLQNPIQRIARSLARLEELSRVEALAKHVVLSPSAFHLHFKAIESLSPL
jgi:hypothetical protein